MRVLLFSALLAFASGAETAVIAADGPGCLFLDGFESGDVCGWTGDCPAPFPAAGASAEIESARATPDGATNLAISDALVTYTKETIGNDQAGFFVQADLAGPALFVSVDPASLSPAPVPGDIVSFRIMEMGTSTGLREALAIADWAVAASGAWVPCYVQNVATASDLVTALDAYESEMVSLQGTLTTSLEPAGPGFEAAVLETAGISGDDDLRLRVTTSVKEQLDLIQGCDVTLVGSPLWRVFSQALPSAWQSSDLDRVSCPDPPPTLTAINLIIDATDCVGACIVGDTLAFVWDNSSTGDANADVSSLSQVEFDLSDFALGTVSPDDLTAGLFSYHWPVSNGSIDAGGLTFKATVTDDSSNVTGPILSSDTVAVDNEVPTVTADNLTIDDSDCTGGPCAAGDDIVFSWDNRMAPDGDGNADVALAVQVAFDLSAVGGSTTQTPNSTVGGVFSYTFTVVTGTLEATGLGIAATITDDAGNSTGPIDSNATVDIDNRPPTILAGETADSDANGQIDRIRLVFSEAIDDSTVDIADFAVTGFTLSGGTSGTANDAEYFLVLTESGTPDTDATPFVAPATVGGVADLAGNLLADEPGVAAYDKAAPVIISAIASDASGGGTGIQAGDLVTIVFSEDTTQPTIDSSNIDDVLALDNGHTWLDGNSIDGTSGWITADTLVIVLDDAPVLPTLAIGDTIELNTNGPVIVDAAGNGISSVAFSAIGGAF